jgi:putative molybdopterin biosynthesis protein
VIFGFGIADCLSKIENLKSKIGNSMNRNIYLRDVPLSDALQKWHAALAEHGLMQPLASEDVLLAAAHGRVTAVPVWARLSSPHYHASAMDGYAVRSSDTLGATETDPKQLALGTQAVVVDTGDPLPAGMNAVIMVEAVQEVEGAIEITQAAPPWQYMRAMGEDIVATELVLPANHRIRPQDLGALAGSGQTSVKVYRRPRVAIIPTGDELVPAGQPVKPGDIIEYNSLVLGAMAEEAGCIVTRFGIIKDNFDTIRNAVAQAMHTHDLVVVNAGSSAGREDFTSRVVSELVTLCVHGIAIRPGHPVILGAGRDPQDPSRGVALAGIPGYPVSAAVTFDLIVRPVLHAWQGQVPPARPTIKAALSRKVVSPLGDDEFVRVTLGQVGERVIATPVGGGAGVITSLVKADGYLTIPRLREGHHAGEIVDVTLTCAPDKVQRTIVMIGSHDLTLDVMANALRQRRPDLFLSSANVGSLGGLMALQRGEAHLAGAHLLDEGSGEYNVSFVQSMLAASGIHGVLMGFVNRVQGLIVPKGNPKGIKTLADLQRDHVTYVNRQRGAGTRILLDYELKKQGIDSRHIRGYERQEFTHLAVAAAVSSQAADCGLGVLSAARALDLDFIPLANERYDLVISAQWLEHEKLAPLLALIRDETSGLREAISQLGGYETINMGRVLHTF